MRNRGSTGIYGSILDPGPRRPGGRFTLTDIRRLEHEDDC